MEKPKIYYVCMTDKMLSDWGRSKGKINKLIFECATMEEAITVKENAATRSEMTYINIRSTKPYYKEARYFTQTKTKKFSQGWYKKGFFDRKAQGK